MSSLKVRNLGRRVLQRNRNERGFTIIEVLVSVFILSLVFFGFAGSMSLYSADLKKLSFQSSRREVSSNFSRSAKSMDSLYNSIEVAANQGLRDCYNGVTATSCKHLQEFEFALHESYKSIPVMDATTGNPVLDASGNPIYKAAMIGGGSSLTCSSNDNPTTPNPVFYSENGRRCSCSESAAVCPLQVITTYAALCSTGTTCRRPAAVKFGYQVKLRDDLPPELVPKFIMKTEKGEQILDLYEDDEYYVKFTAGRSYDTTSSGGTVLNQGISEADIRQGKALPYKTSTLQLGKVELEASFTSSQEVTAVEFLYYKYPSSCKINTVGSGGCTLPAETDFVQLERVVIPPMKIGTASAAMFVPVGVEVMDFRVNSYDQFNQKLNSSKYDMRAFFSDTGSVLIIPPVSPRDSTKNITHSCDPSSPDNKFVFQASSFSGWKSLNVTLSPPLTSDGTSTGAPISGLPGFTAFDKSNPNPQDIIVDPRNFEPGQTYTMTMTGVTNDDKVASTSVVVRSANLPAEVVSIENPLDWNLVRTISNLNYRVAMNLACGEAIQSAKIEIVKESPLGDVLMPQREIKGNCVAQPGTYSDENKFTCDLSLPCTEWLNVSSTSQCSTIFPTQTTLRAKASATDTSSKVINAIDRRFYAGTKITATLDSNSVEWVNIKAAGLVSRTLASYNYIPVKVNLSSTLLAGESIQLKLVGPGVNTTYTCAYGNVGAVLTSYTGGSTPSCTLRLNQAGGPFVPGAINLETMSPDFVEVAAPSTISITEVNDAALSCTTMAHAPVCGAGQSMKRLLTKAPANYDLIYQTNAASPSFTIDNYTLKNSQAGIDLIYLYKPQMTVKPTFAVRVRALMSSDATSNSYAEFNANIDPGLLASCSSDDKMCPESYFMNMPGAIIANQPLFATKSFSVTVTPGAFSNSSPSVLREILVMRECYCE